MLFLFVAFIIGLSGSVFGAVIYGKEPGRIIPVTWMGIVTILYGFGIAGHFALGIYAVIALVIFLYAVTLLFIIHKNITLRQFVSAVITPAMLIFVLLFILLNVLYVEMVAHSWDEFSHWADVVKAMTYINDFATNPDSHSQFQSYPPGMALLQYFFQKLHMFMRADKVFTEWRLYLAYQTFALSMFFPFLEEKELRTFEKIVLFLGIAVSVLVFYPDFYGSIYIDPFVAILAGTTFALIFNHIEKDKLYDIHICLACVNLVLAKDIGIFFAVFVIMAYVINKVDFMIQNDGDKGTNVLKMFGGGYDAFSLFIPLISAIITKLLWNFEVKSTGAKKSFSQAIQIFEYLKMYFLQNDTTYRQSVVDASKAAFFEYTVRFAGFQVSYFLLFVFCTLLLVFISANIYKPGKAEAKLSRIANIIIPILQVIVYAFFIGAVYVYRFSEYEASILASYSRYMNISFAALWIVVLLGLFQAAAKSKIQRAAAIFLACSCLVTAPLGNIRRFINRDIVKEAQEVRSEFVLLAKEIEKICDGNDKIYFLSRGDRGLHYWITRFNARPNYVIDPFGGWSLGDAIYDGDIWHIDISPEEWIEQLINEEYDYVAIYRAGDDFSENYGSVFGNVLELSDNSLYKINRDQRILERCR